MKFCILAALVLTSAMAFSQAITNPPRNLIFRAGYDNGPALVDIQLKSQHRVYGLASSGIVQYVIWQCDGGASTFQLAYRRNGSVNLITPLMVPSTFGTVSGTIACVSKDGKPRQWEGNNVPCGNIGNIGVAIGDTFETTSSPTADGVSKSCSAFLVVQ